MELLNGKKTFIVGIGSILGAIGGVMTGTLDMGTAINTVVMAVMGMTLRDGIAKLNK